jgi:DNA-binding LytR/AlgR family response regulator
MLQPFFIWQNKSLIKIKPEDVVSLKADGNYLKIFLSNKTFYTIRSTLTETLRLLPPDIFIKVSRSDAASIYYIDKIERDHLIIVKKPMPIARRYFKSVLAQLNIVG